MDAIVARRAVQLRFAACTISLLMVPSLAGQLWAASSASIQAQNPPSAADATSPARLVDESPTELVKSMPELSGLQPAANQTNLPLILKKVGENVEAYFRNYVSTTAQEDTVQQRLQMDGQVEETFKNEYRYLVITHPGNGSTDWDEYRTDKDGKPAGTNGPSGALLTARFAYVPIYLDSKYQEETDFSYVGQQVVDGHQCQVIAFSQWPPTARLFVTLTDGSLSYKAFVQGLAWIDATSYQIIRMYTELLPDPVEIAVKQQTTDVTFEEVHFPGINTVLWLPRDVVVNTNWAGRRFRNLHHYSDYKLYASQTKMIFQ
jgi:hypothetical protein